jgi:uncharacterized phage protein (TIGR02218 family)
MKAASPGLLALLASRQFYLLDLFQFTLFDGTVLRYAAAAQDIYAEGDLAAASDLTAVPDLVVYPDVAGAYDVTLISDLVTFGNKYACGGVEGGPYFEREGDNSQVQLRAGLQVSTLQFTVYPGTAQVLGFSFKRAVLVGLFDGAQVQLKRAVMPTYGDTGAGVVTLFSGRVGQINADRAGGVQFTVNSFVELLDQNMPRNLFQSGCIWTLYDDGCTLDQARFSQTGSVSSGSTALVLNVSMPQATGYFDQGKVQFTSGANKGLVIGVRKYVQGSPGALTLLQPLPVTPGVGDSFLASAGCDKLQATCSDKFNNLSNYLGFPYIPIPETAA